MSILVVVFYSNVTLQVDQHCRKNISTCCVGLSVIQGGLCKMTSPSNWEKWLLTNWSTQTLLFSSGLSFRNLTRSEFWKIFGWFSDNIISLSSKPYWLEAKNLILGGLSMPASERAYTIIDMMSILLSRRIFDKLKKNHNFFC